MPDKDGYPLKAELKEIEMWSHISSLGDMQRFVNFLKGLWWLNAEGFRKYEKSGIVYIELHTYGWSGNEEVIGVLQETLFWTFFWQKSERGGHYYFEIKKTFFKK